MTSGYRQYIFDECWHANRRRVTFASVLECILNRNLIFKAAILFKLRKYLISIFEKKKQEQNRNQITNVNVMHIFLKNYWENNLTFK